MKKILAVAALGAAAMTASNAQAGGCSVGNLSAWDQTANTTGMIDVTAGAAMASTACGMAVSTADTSAKVYVGDLIDQYEPRYRARFYIDVNNLALPDTGPRRRVKFHTGVCRNSQGGNCFKNTVVNMKIENNGGNLQLKSFVRDEGAAGNKRKFDLDIPDSGEVAVEYEVIVGNPGEFRIWVNADAEADMPAFEFTDLNLGNFDGIDRFRVGLLDTPPNAQGAGTFFLDEVETRRQTFIGCVGGVCP